MKRISGYQLFAITLLFQIGSTIVFGFASTAGRDAWIAALISSVLGSMLLVLYIVLMRMQPGLTLVEWFPAQFGRWLGTPVAWLYPLAFLYVAGRVLRDFGDLIATTILPQTPMLVIMATFAMLVAYILYHGIESFARVGEFLLPLVLLMYAGEVTLLLGSDIVHWEYLQPVLEKGWGRVWEAVWPLGVTVPYGESIVFAMIWTMANQPKRIMQVTLLSAAIYGILITFADIMAVAIMGEVLFQRSIYPLYTILLEVRVADFIENLNPLGVVYICIMGVFKVGIFMFGAIRGIQQLTPVRHERILILPAAIAVLIMAIKMAPNVAAHAYVGLKIVPQLLWVPLFLVLPSILLAVTLIRKKLASP